MKDFTIKPQFAAAEELRQLFTDQIQDIYWAEKALVSALPKMRDNASAPVLIDIIEDHWAVTKEQVMRLEKIFSILGETPRGKKCEAMEGLIKEEETLMAQTKPGPVRDAAIIAASQKIEHYEIATYGTLAAFARTLEEDAIVSLLTDTLAEEKEADAMLTESAYHKINLQAAAAGENEQE
jgi:ferritin-like metal-binding protein YciE